MGNIYKKGLVSVIIPTYKRSDMLKRAINSVLNQSYRDVECIVVNDNTPGDEYSQILYQMLAEFDVEGRFVFVEQPAHKNGAAARNAGIRVARGEYIAFLDDDDYWDNNKLEIQIDVLKALPFEWGAVSCLMRLYHHGVIFSANRPYKDGYIHYEVLTRCISMGTGSLVIRRRALDETGYFDENLCRFQDPQLFSSLTEKYKVRLVKKYLHNRDVDDAQNRPTIESISTYQEAFYKSVSPQLKRLPKRKVNILKVVFDFDKALILWNSGNKRKAIKCVLNVLRYPEATYYATKRIWDRYANQVGVNYRLSRYKA